MLLTRAGDVDGELAALEFLVVEFINGTLRGFGFGEFHKRKATR
jgi:hypothetical protein